MIKKNKKKYEYHNILKNMAKNVFFLVFFTFYFLFHVGLPLVLGHYHAIFSMRVHKPHTVKEGVTYLSYCDQGNSSTEVEEKHQKKRGSYE